MKECFREPVQRVKGVKILKASSKVMTFSANFCAGSVYLFTLHNKENCWHILHNIDK